MRRSVVGFFLAVVLSLHPAFAASAAQSEALLTKMKVVREIDLGSVFEYEVETEGRGRAILKTAPFRLKVGEAINLFVAEGASENGKPTYMALAGGRARSFKEGFAAVYFGRRWGFIDKNGNLLAQDRFERVRDFNDGLAFVLRRNDYAFLGKDGKILKTPLIYPANNYFFLDLFDSEIPITGFNEGFVVMMSETAEGDTLFVILDKTGAVTKRLSDIKGLDVAWQFSEGLAPVKYAVNYEEPSPNILLFGYMDTNGAIAIPAQFAEARPFREGLAAVKVNKDPYDIKGIKDKWGFIDKSGKIVIGPKYDDVAFFSEGLAAVRAGGKWGFIDKSGNIAIGMSYDDVRSFSEGIAVVQRGNAWGAIDKNGQVVVKFLFSEMKSFADGLAPAVNNNAVMGKWGFIDKQGNFVIKPEYDLAESFSEGLALVSEEIPDHSVDKWQYIDTKGQTALWFYMYS